MKCQLARVVNSNILEYEGKLLWVKIQRPFTRKIRNMRTHIRGIGYNIVTIPYFSLSEPTRKVVVKADCLELLPFFKEVELSSIEDWIAKGGETMPTEELHE